MYPVFSMAETVSFSFFLDPYRLRTTVNRLFTVLDFAGQNCGLFPIVSRPLPSSKALIHKLAIIKISGLEALLCFKLSLEEL